MKLKNRKILLAVSGSIAAYKAAGLVRLFVKEGALVKVIMTESSKDFVTPVTMATFSKNPVYSSFLKNNAGEWNNHVELGLWADIMVIAPASANSIAKCANGLCDNLLTAVYLSARCPVFFAPAMDLDMFAHPATQANLIKLKSFGNQVIGPAKGELASGLVGEGRMEEPEIILEHVVFLNDEQSLIGKKILITAGPTQEAIDPVRYISNHSSGKMGFEMATAFANKGADVTLVSGPSLLQFDHKKINRINVITAAQMHEACMKVFPSCHVAIMAAAVADFTPESLSDKKIKKSESFLQIALKPTVDILEEMGKKKKKGQMLIGFALETNNELNNALKKLEVKNLDYIILNSMNDKGATFNSDQNKITIIDKKRNKTSFDLKSKKLVAQDIIHTIFNK